MAEYYKRVSEFESVLRHLLQRSDIWDNIHVVTDIDSYVRMPFYGVSSEHLETDEFDKVYYDLKIYVHYTDFMGEQQVLGYLMTSTNFDEVLRAEGKLRKIIPMIFE